MRLLLDKTISTVFNYTVDTEMLKLLKLLVVPLILLLSTVANSQSIRPQEHPNHYILLIDASGSIKKLKARWKIYEQVMRQTLPSRLYVDGFGENIPRFDPDHDFITLLNFGIVPGGIADRYAHFRSADFLTELIHPVYVRKKNVKRPELEAELLPKQYFEYTALSWSKQSALIASKAQSPEIACQRTFLIIVHDDLFNENGLSQELDEIKRTQNSSISKAIQMVEDINKDYLFCDTEGNQGWAWQELLPKDRPLIYIDVYEVRSADQKNWQNEITNQKVFDELKLEGSSFIGDSSQVLLAATLNEEFLRKLGATQGTQCSIRLTGEDYNSVTQVKLNSNLEVPVNLGKELPCDSQPFKLLIEIPINQSDKQLGTRTVNYISREESLSAPLPFRCTLLADVWNITRWVILGLIVLTLIYFFYFRLYATHIQVDMPGLLVPIRIKRNEVISCKIPVSPRAGLEAFSLKLPNEWIQRLFYREATIKVETNGEAKVQMQENGEKRGDIKLPRNAHTIPWNWDVIPDQRTELTMTFQQKNQEGKILLSYPKGFSG
jgi:hypothetical protein